MKNVIKKILRKLSSYLFFGLFVYLLIGLFLPKASAQLTVQSITITNPVIQFSVNPGDKKEGTLSLINDSNGDITFVTGVYDFIVQDSKGTPEILPFGTITNNKYSGANWVAVYPAGFTAKAGQRYNLNYYIQVPKDAAPGGHYAAIVYQPITNTPGQGTGASIHSQIASLVYISVNGPVKEQAQVTKFKAKGFQEFGPVEVDTQIQNLGDLHIRPDATILVKNIFGKTVASEQLTPRNIFPGGVVVNYTNKLGSMWMLGRYKAELVGSYGIANNLPLSASVYFWVFPWRISIIVVLLIIAAVLGYFAWKRRKEQQAQIAQMHEAAKPDDTSTDQTPPTTV